MTQIELAEAQLAKKWGRWRDAVRVSSLSRTIIYDLIKKGLIESFVFLGSSTPGKSGQPKGARMINLESLTAFLDSEAAKAKERAQ